MLDYTIRHSGYFAGIEEKGVMVEEEDHPPEENRVVDVLDHDDGGVVTLLLLLSAMVRRCGDGLADEHSVLENTLLCETLTSTLFRVLKIKKECGNLYF